MRHSERRNPHLPVALKVTPDFSSSMNPSNDYNHSSYLFQGGHVNYLAFVQSTGHLGVHSSDFSEALDHQPWDPSTLDIRFGNDSNLELEFVRSVNPHEVNAYCSDRASWEPDGEGTGSSSAPAKGRSRAVKRQPKKKAPAKPKKAKPTIRKTATHSIKQEDTQAISPTSIATHIQAANSPTPYSPSLIVHRSASPSLSVRYVRTPSPSPTLVALDLESEDESVTERSESRSPSPTLSSYSSVSGTPSKRLYKASARRGSPGKSAKKSMLVTHSPVGGASRPLPWICPVEGCGHRTKTKHDLRRHLMTKGHARKAFVCFSCSKDYTRQDARLRHLKKEPDCLKPHIAECFARGLPIKEYTKML
ncbi:hypothetical protein HGRIS_000916 [Hohenbuehelia grisea]|uniref:C2H2-type domain-containing protein n=1 Tax=Hohenbuehelia grisea TaxID=104357 RepID=A0ABR3IQ61_9AGAR